MSLTQLVGPTGLTLSADGTTWEGQIVEATEFSYGSVCTGVTEFSEDQRNNLVPLSTGISHIGSFQAQWAARTRWEQHSQVLQGQSIAGLSNKRCVCSRRSPFLSVFIVLVSPGSGVKPH